MPRSLTWPVKRTPFWRPCPIISFRARCVPCRNSRSRGDEVLVSIASHLSPDEEHTLFLLGGSNNVVFQHFERTLTQQHILRRDADIHTYEDRISGVGNFALDGPKQEHTAPKTRSKRKAARTNDSEGDETTENQPHRNKKIRGGWKSKGR